MLWLLFAAVQIAATMSPGPAFVMAVRSALVHGRRTGILTSIGLGLGVAAHVAFVLTGLSLIVSQSVFLYNIIKYLGAAYLVYIGVQGLLAKPHKSKLHGVHTKPAARTPGPLKALSQGFLTNLLNPKAVIFFTAVFTQFITPETTLGLKLVFAFTSTGIEMIWFSLVAIILTHAAVRARFTAISHWIERVSGGLLMGLGVRLALSRN